MDHDAITLTEKGDFILGLWRRLCGEAGLPFAPGVRWTEAQHKRADELLAQASAAWDRRGDPHKPG
jgi:hypothetical protein